ncbi:EAL domain-containing protein [uncultured Paraglaciecola sp.]|uniref:sensor domain-containing protein n=1 Tax=uncultured Paraglaciecola sp. TaxID=1765024 RepID=UPI0030DCFCB5|tara:strand:+ start:55625 stop:57925 length:2301 start_codon:yes stop_codon:yes gene_type:complete
MRIDNENIARRARYLYFFIVTVGLLLSALVYFMATAVKHSTTELVVQRLPALSNINHVATLTSEQERILYEYYATTNVTPYQEYYSKNHTVLSDLLLSLQGGLQDSSTSSLLKEQLEKTAILANHLDQNLSSPTIDWDLAREQLKNISNIRRELLPVLEAMGQQVILSVDTAYDNTIYQLNSTVWLVALFTMGLIAFTFYLGRYAMQYIKLSAENGRLALFPLRNPNPILSVDENLNIRYSNPATEKLLHSFSHKTQNPLSMFSTDLKQQLHETRVSESNVRCFLNRVNETYLSYEIHWLKDVDAFDIHVQDVSEQHIARNKLEYIAYHNQTTKLKNQSSLEVDSQALIASAIPFSLLLFEVVQYKQLVGSYGLTGASECIESFSAALKLKFEQLTKNLNLSHSSYIYHIADANFVIVVPVLNQTKVLDNLVTRLIGHFADTITTPFGTMSMSACIGASEYPRCSSNLKELLLHANIALDEATKRDELFSCFDHESGSRHERHVFLMKRLEQAISGQEFELYFQPKMDVLTKEYDSCECLIRWFTDDGGTVSPAEFIPLAEKSGLILPLGEWILDNAFLHAKRWHEKGMDMCVAINISARQFSQVDFVKGISKRLKDHQLPAKYIELEITETVVMNDETLAIKTLNNLKALGVKLSIDDFGTGFSSLAYLKSFPVDKLKIDQSFIRNMVKDNRDQAIVLSLCQLSKNLDLSVIAEGVEEQAQLDMLRDFHCSHAQGYLLSRPLPVDVFEQFIKSVNLAKRHVELNR